MAKTRLTQRKQFLYVAKGAYAAKSALVVQARKADPAHEGIRAGFTATKKTGNAVRRNRAKRRLRAVSHILLESLGRPGWDYVFIARNNTADIKWNQLLDEAKAALLSLRHKTKCNQ